MEVKFYLLYGTYFLLHMKYILVLHPGYIGAMQDTYRDYLILVQLTCRAGTQLKNKQ